TGGGFALGGFSIGEAEVVERAPFGGGGVETLFDLAEAGGVDGVNGGAVRVREGHGLGEGLVGVLTEEHGRVPRGSFGGVLEAGVIELGEVEVGLGEAMGDGVRRGLDRV